MLNVERALQINIALLVMLGALLLGLGNGNMWLPAMAFVASLTSLYLTDIYRVLSLNRIVANLASILAAVYSLNDFFRNNSESQLLSIASFLIYLQILLQFQTKTSRIYWQLLVLSLLQVVVAAALYVRVESGLLFVVYMVLAITAMTLTYIYRENKEIRERSERAATELRQSRQAATTAVSRLHAAPILLFNSEHTEPKTTGMLMRRAVLAGGAAVLLAGVLFYCVPKPDKTWRGINAEDANRTGFSTEIRFDKSGRIAQSDRVVFRASLTDPKTMRKFELDGEPYFRGMALHRYNIDRRSMTWQESAPMSTRFTRSPLPNHERRGGLDILEVDMEGTELDVLFTINPSHALPDTPTDMVYEPFSSTLIRDMTSAGIKSQEPYRYKVALGLVRDRKQPDMFPYYDLKSRSFEEPMDPGTKISMTQRKADTQTYIAKLAKDLTADIDRNERREIAQTLSDHLQFSNQFRYTLDFGSVEFNRNLDPIEDFVKNHRVGNCEYFASALCLMLRSLNIPCRIVVGYRGGDYNKVAQHYVVRDKHAHAWVEVYLEPEHLTDEEINSGVGGPSGAWLRLDPTPASLASEGDDIFSAANDALDLAQVLWDDLVFGFNKDRQKSYYSRLLGESSYFDQVFRLSEIDDSLGDVAENLGIDRGYRRILAQLIVVSLLALTALTWWFWRRRRLSRIAGGKKPVPIRKIIGSVATLISPKLGRWISGPVISPLQGEPVDFYEQFARILKRAGWQRGESQTQSEFVQQVQQELLERHAESDIATHLDGIVDAFYLVRFGGKSLSQPQQETVLKQLSKLETFLSSRNAPAIGSTAT